MTRKIYILLLPIMLFAACANPPDFPDQPTITFKQLNRTTFNQCLGCGDDRLFVTLEFTDGDGDIGGPADQKDLFFQDTRIASSISDSTTAVNLPVVSKKGASNGISGEIVLDLTLALGDELCCFHPRDFFLPCEPMPDYPMDTTTFLIKILDQAGNESNVVETEPVFIICD